MPRAQGTAARPAPHGPVSVRFKPEALAAIAEAISSGDAESGGLLLGAVGFDGAFTVVVEAIDAVPGRFWAAAPESRERRGLESALAAWRPSPDRPLCCVGYFRATAHEVLGPAREDLVLIARYFSAPHHVFLFVHPDDSDVATAGYVTWERGNIPESAATAFPLPAVRSVPEPAAEPEALPDRIAYLERPPAQRQPRRALLPAPAAEPESIGAREGFPLHWIALAAALFVVLAAAVLLFVRRGAEPASQQGFGSVMALKVERAGDDLRVTWDRSAPAIQRATHGSLTITDGEFRKELSLDAAALRGGTLLYTPASNDVDFRLSATGASTVAESVRVLSGKMAGALSRAAGDAPAVTATARPHASERGAFSTSPSTQPGSPQPTQPRELRPFVPPSARAAPRAGELAAPSLSASSAALASAGPGVALPAAPPPPPPEEQAKATATAQDAKPAPRVSQYSPPRPVSQVSPLLTAGMRAAVQRAGAAVQVDVEVQVDAAGRVAGAQLAGAVDPLRQLLADAALRAARQWQFEPGRLNGEAIPTRVVLAFRFGPR